MQDDIFALIAEAMPKDSARQSYAEAVVQEARERIRAANTGRLRVMDLGAGDGRSFEKLKAILGDIDWVGLDIAASPEISTRTRTDIPFVTYDGVNIPFEDNWFDLIYSKQVLEHVRKPDELMANVARCLKPGGAFIGSVSQLEPYHSYSVFNWSVYGVAAVFSDAGLKLTVLRPGIDGVSLILRRLLPHPAFNNMFSSFESLFNHMISAGRFNTSMTVAQENFQKLIVAGHLVFWAEKVCRQPG